MKKLAFSYFFFLAFILIFFSSGAIESQDGFLYTAVARNIYYTGAPTAPFYDWSKPTRENANIPLNVYEGKDGKTYTRTGIGFSLFLLPAVFVSDLVYKFTNTSPSLNFPLQSDWLILMMASWTNSFLAAGLGVVVFLYLLLFNLSKKQALLISTVMIFCTNLFILSKSTLAHLMFALFLVLTFFLIKKYSIDSKKSWLFFAGFSLGLTMISYNMTFLLALPSIFLYYWLLVKDKTNWLRCLKVFLLGFIPFVGIFLWYEMIRQEAAMSFGGRDLRDTLFNLRHIPVGVFFEGLYGQLLSPGRSLFLYSPVLLIPILFWHKIKRNVLPELIISVSLLIIYVIFYALQYQVIKPEYGITGFWHGEVSWGPRYLSVLIPFGILIVGFIYKQLTLKTKLLIFLPLILVGFYIELLAVVIPYQTKFRGLEQNFFVNETYHPVEIYSNFLPRYSPVLIMSKNMAYLIRDFPKTINNGAYNLRFYDGIDFPFNVGKERWRTIEDYGLVIFDNNQDGVKSLSLGLINHPNTISSSSAQIKLFINDTQVKEVSLEVEERQMVKILTDNLNLKDIGNRLVVQTKFDPPIKLNNQIVVFNSFAINDQRQNIETLNYPFVSNLGPALTGVKYENYGGLNKNPWRFWDLHTQIYERTPDFWWIKPIFYWDLPNKLFGLLFILNVSGIVFFGYLTYKSLSKQKL